MTTVTFEDIAASDQDLGLIESSEWQSRKMPVRRKPDVDTPIVIKRSVLNEIQSHGRGAPEIEVCGVLIGNVYRDGGRPYVHIEGSIRGNHAASKSAQVTFTADTWTHIQDVLDNEHPNKRILGWYHTHPGYGIFLSEMDLFIQRNFFSLPWHTALVFDPAANEDGLFAWRGGNVVSESYLVQEDAAAITIFDAPENKAGKRAPAPVAGAGAQPGTVMELTARLQAMENRQRYLLAGMALCAVLAFAWPLLINMISPSLKNEAAADVDIAALRQIQPPAAPGAAATPHLPMGAKGSDSVKKSKLASGL